MQKEYKVSAIKNGSVIDHIPCESLFQVITILNLNKCSFPITFGVNLESDTIGKKALIKVTEYFFAETDINRIALVAPNATLSVIKNYKVVSKQVVDIPEIVRGIVKCVNPNCITQNQDISTAFKVIERSPTQLRCTYCRKITNEENFYFL